jgi:hypothetical protein
LSEIPDKPLTSSTGLFQHVCVLQEVLTENDNLSIMHSTLTQKSGAPVTPGFNQAFLSVRITMRLLMAFRKDMPHGLAATHSRECYGSYTACAAVLAQLSPLVG